MSTDQNVCVCTEKTEDHGLVEHTDMIPKQLHDGVTKHAMITAIKNGKACTRRFDSNTFECGQEIVCSKTTYHGLHESLKLLESRLSRYIPEICVLCPMYQSMLNCGPADTQACVGGKIENNMSMDDRFISGFREQLRKKLRICDTIKPCCMSKTKVPLKGKSSAENKTKKPLKMNVLTQVWVTKASECCNVPDFDAMTERIKRVKGVEKTERKKWKNSIEMYRIGCIVWGTFDELMELVASIPVEKSKIGGTGPGAISAVSIISLNKAIEMSSYALQYLPGVPSEQELF